MRCFSCDAEAPLAAGERVGFRECCERCGADLHVCLTCAFHDSAAYNECREPNTERVSDRDRANRCEYWSAGEGGGGAVETARRGAQSQLEDLFKR